jgi:hypothetical protein
VRGGDRLLGAQTIQQIEVVGVCKRKAHLRYVEESYFDEHCAPRCDHGRLGRVSIRMGFKYV